MTFQVLLFRYTSNLNTSQWAIIGQTFESVNGVKSSEIAKVLDVEPPLVTLLVDQHAEKGFIERVNHPKDHRAKLLFLTRTGKELVPRVEKLLKETLLRLLKDISPEDLKAYQRVLEGIVGNESSHY